MGFIKTILFSLLFGALVGILFTSVCAAAGIPLGGF